MLDGDDALFTDQYVPQRSLRVVAEVGYGFPLYCTACGKALLAELPRDEVSFCTRRRSPRSRATPSSIAGALLEEIDVARGAGVAYDHQEHTLGVSAVGAALRDAGGAMAAITVAMPAARLEGREERIAAALLRARDDIQKAINAG